MRVALVGADFEENLGIGMIASALEEANHSVEIVPFNLPEEANAIASHLARSNPSVIGLSIQFQHRVTEFFGLAQTLRTLGYQGHITCGGQFPTLAWQETLQDQPAIDTIVLHEGEVTIVELLAALKNSQDISSVPGIAYRTEVGVPQRSGCRRLLEQLDQLPFAKRYRAFTKHSGVPFVPIMGSRGCWGSCSYCSITSFYRDARAYGGGKTLRHRSPENIAAEMALLWHQAGGQAIFCFHDDNFLLPKPEASLERVKAIRTALDGYGVTKAGMIGKCRPDSMTRELAKALRELGVLRLYVGVENASSEGATHLNRKTQQECVREALAACREAGIFVCYNLLLFEPDATIENIRENIQFIRDHSNHPVNFCRAEPYYGTPLHKTLASRSGLNGSYLGWNYTLESDKTELLFRVCAAVFRQRNFDPAGVANRYMGLGYSAKLIEYFYDGHEAKRNALVRRAGELTKAISQDTADFLEEATNLVENMSFSDIDTFERQVALLGMKIAAADAVWHGALDELYNDMEKFGELASQRQSSLRIPPALSRAVHQLTLGASLMISAAGCKSPAPTNTMVVDPVPPPTQPYDARTPGYADAGALIMRDVNYPTVVDMVPIPPVVVDPLPPPMAVDSGRPIVPIAPDPPPPPFRVDAGRPIIPIAPDPVPRPVRVDAGVRRPPPTVPIAPDPVPHPPRIHVTDPVPSPHRSPKQTEEPRKRLNLIDQWTNTTTKAVGRTRALPLGDPPNIAIFAKKQGERYRVWIEGAQNNEVGIRWQSKGKVDGTGLEVEWTPSSPSDQIRVAVRSYGGIAIAALRALDAV